MEQIHYDFPLTKQQQEKKQQIVKRLLHEELIQKWMIDHHADAEYINDHSSKFADWHSNKEKCLHCKGLSFCRQSVTGYFMELYVDGMLQQQLVPCSYMMSFNKKDHIKKLYRMCDIPEELLSVELGKLNLKAESNEYRDVVNKVADRLLNEADQKGVYFYGKPGVGKTYLAAAISNHFADKGVPCAFVNIPNLISNLKRLFQEPEAMEQQIRLLKQIDLLVMDDIGGESMTSWSRDDILLPILEARLQHQKRTIFTSNYSLGELKDRFEITNNRMREPIAALRLLDRIKALSDPLFVRGESRRY